MAVRSLATTRCTTFGKTGIGPSRFLSTLSRIQVGIRRFDSVNSNNTISFFRILGVSTRGFGGLGPLRRLSGVSRAVGKVSSGSTFAFLSRVKSSSLHGLLPILQGNKTRFGELHTRTRQLGLALSSMSALATSRLKGSFTRLRGINDATFDGVITSVTPRLATLARVIARTVINVSGSARTPIGSVNRAFLSIFSNIMTDLGFALRIGGTFIITCDTVGRIILSFTAFGLGRFRFLSSVCAGDTGNLIGVFQTTFTGGLRFLGSAFVRPVGRFTTAFGLSTTTNRVSGFRNILDKLRRSSDGPVRITARGGDVNRAVGRLRMLGSRTRGSKLRGFGI